MLQNIVIEGLDRLGKSTLVANLKDRLGHFTALHYGKPEVLSYYERRVGYDSAREAYQRESFSGMFKLLSSDARIIMDRGHLGEAVYAHRYRGYDGRYIFDLEQGKAVENTLLVLLTNTDPDLEPKLVDDGLGFDWSKRAEEQADFLQAFRDSKLQHKVLVNVGYGSSNPYMGTFIDQHLLAEQVAHAFTSSAWYTEVNA